MAHMEVKKMKQGMSYSCKEKTIILNVFKYFRTQFPDKCVTELVRKTAKATGCSEKSIFQFRKEETSPSGFKEPSKTKIRKNININSRFIKYDDNVRQAIRNIVYDLKYRNIVPSLSTILKNVNSDDTLPNFSLMTLRRLLFDMGFCYEKNGNKSVLTEKSLKQDTPQQQNKPKIQKNHMLNDQNQSNPPLQDVNTISPVKHENIPNTNTLPNNVYPQITHQQHHRTVQEYHIPGHHGMPMVYNRMPPYPLHQLGNHNINIKGDGHLMHHHNNHAPPPPLPLSHNMQMHS